MTDNNKVYDQLPFQFTEENLNSDPDKFWQHINTATLNNLSGTWQQQMTGFLQAVLNVVSTMGEELVYLRTLETRIQNESLTEEILRDILGKLGAFRQRIREMAEKEQAQHKKLMEAAAQSVSDIKRPN